MTKYRLIEPLGSDATTEVFLGQATNVEGFKRLVALRRVRPHLASRPDFIARVLDGSRLAARISHANIVTVLDIGKADDSYFIVTEFVDGQSLKEISNALQFRRERFPLQAAIYIVTETCNALAYLHELLDPDGVSGELVHENLSLATISISKREKVKISNPELAKASIALEHIEPDLTTETLGYRSPEVVSAKEADARADIFALGSCLWEMLAGRRLFPIESQQSVHGVLTDRIPSLVDDHPDVNPQFEGLLLKALAEDPSDRFESARDFGDALASYVSYHLLEPRPRRDMWTLVGKAFRREAEEQRMRSLSMEQELEDWVSLKEW